MKDKKGTATSSEEARKARSADALRANLLKRKAQTRARRAGEADSRPQGIEASRPASES